MYQPSKICFLSLIILSCGCTPSLSQSPSPTPAQRNAAEWSVTLNDHEENAVKVSADGRAVFQRASSSQLLLILSRQRVAKIEQAWKAIPPNQWSATASNGSLVLLEKDHQKLHLQVQPSQPLVEMLRELEPHPYARDKEDAWLCGVLEEAPEKGAVLTITPPDEKPVGEKSRYRLEPVPNIERKGVVILMVAGRVDSQAVDTQMVGPTYVVSSWARWEASASRPKTSSTTLPSPSAAP